MYNACGGQKFAGALHVFGCYSLFQLHETRIGEISQVSENEFTEITWYRLQNWQRLTGLEK
jgi:hypothetical protein